ncbi:hypothetical protein M405DRAFT_729842 [Rhizopogon salebrosus TDB-379]|nr:hypothetical protein M405DRAFT_729842 [Rhizopogon salebrosus TDB-379]
MPLRGTPTAPKFDGNPRELIRYFEDVEQLADAAALTDVQRIKATLRYIHRDDAETWEILPEVKAGDFDKFCEAVKELYPGCKEDKSYMRDDLKNLVANQAKKTMHSQDDVGDYLRKFRRISTYLISNNRLADPGRDRMFLEGLHQEYVMTQSTPCPPVNCYFCGRTRHRTRRCSDIESYIASGKVIRNEDNHIVLADGTNIPTRIGATLKDEVDSIINNCRREEPPHVIAGLFACSGPEIEVELDIEPSAFLQTADTVVSSTSAPIDTSKSTIVPSTQYSYQCPLEDPTANKRVLDSVMQTVVSIPVQDILSIAPEVCKQVKEQMTTRRVSVHVAVAELAGHHPERLWGEFEHMLNRSDNGSITAHHSIPLKCIEATVLGKVLTCVLDQGAEIIVMRKDIWQNLSVPLRSDHLMTMESANTNKDATLGVIENLGFDFGAGEIRLQVQVIERANFDVLLGRPFYAHTSCKTQDFINGDQNLTLSDPNTGKEIMIATKNWLKVCPRCLRNLHCANHCKVLGLGF